MQRANEGRHAEYLAFRKTITRLSSFIGFLLIGVPNAEESRIERGYRLHDPGSAQTGEAAYMQFCDDDSTQKWCATTEAPDVVEVLKTGIEKAIADEFETNLRTHSNTKGAIVAEADRSVEARAAAPGEKSIEVPVAAPGVKSAEAQRADEAQSIAEATEAQLAAEAVSEGEPRTELQVAAVDQRAVEAQRSLAMSSRFTMCNLSCRQECSWKQREHSLWTWNHGCTRDRRVHAKDAMPKSGAVGDDDDPASSNDVAPRCEGLNCRTAIGCACEQ